MLQDVQALPDARGIALDEVGIGIFATPYSSPTARATSARWSQR